MMPRMRKADDQHSDEETERIARDAIRRSFETPYKPQKELVGKTPRARERKRTPSKTTKKPK
jgi:hypothetical protein